MVALQLHALLSLRREEKKIFRERGWLKLEIRKAAIRRAKERIEKSSIVPEEGRNRCPPFNRWLFPRIKAFDKRVG